MSTSRKLSKPSKASRKMALPAVRAIHWLASRARSRTPARFPLLASPMPYRSTSSRTIGYPSLSFTPTPDRPLASIEDGARYFKAEAGPSNWRHGSATPCPVAASPTPRPRYQPYRLRKGITSKCARKIMKWIKVNAHRIITPRNVRYLANYLHVLQSREVLKSGRYLQVAFAYSDTQHSFFPSQDPCMVSGTTLGDYFDPKPERESVASAKVLALILQCASRASPARRACTRCAADRVGADKRSFRACRQMKMEGNKWLNRGACLNCWGMGKHARCSLVRRQQMPPPLFGPSHTRSGKEYGE